MRVVPDICPYPSRASLEAAMRRAAMLAVAKGQIQERSDEKEASHG